MTCAVEGESARDSSNGSLTFHVIERVGWVLGTGQDASWSRDEALCTLWLSVTVLLFAAMAEVPMRSLDIAPDHAALVIMELVQPKKDEGCSAQAASLP